MGRYSVPLAPRFAEFAGVVAGQRALDVGCGPGALTQELVKRLGASAVCAVDPSELFVSAARSRHAGVNVQRGVAEARSSRSGPPRRPSRARRQAAGAPARSPIADTPSRGLGSARLPPARQPAVTSNGKSHQPLLSWRFDRPTGVSCRTPAADGESAANAVSGRRGGCASAGSLPQCRSRCCELARQRFA
jgi:SAM-dependent methyltransferase